MSYAIILIAFILAGCSTNTSFKMQCDQKCSLEFERSIDETVTKSMQSPK